MNDLTLLTTHFHEFRWMEIWSRQMAANTPAAAIREIIVIDQDRCVESRQRLARIDPRFRVLQFPRSEPHFAAAGHDHAAVLNAAMREARGGIICLFDSDAYPLGSDWLPRCRELLQSHDAVLAACHDAPALSHPCFMVLRRELVDTHLRFDDALFTHGCDTGRRIGAQLREAGARVALIQPTVGFSGCWGSVYLDSIYHHGSGSFHGGTPLVKAQLTWLHHFFTELVFRESRYSLTTGERVVVRMLYFMLYGSRIRLERIWNRLRRTSGGRGEAPRRGR